MKILMVCLGNICRSPLADGVLRHKVNQQKLQITVDSAGTANYHIGEAPDPRMVETAKNNGVDISFLRARQFKYDDFLEFDRIYVMDQQNYKNVIQLAKTDSDKKKVSLIMQLISDPKVLEVPDPYYGDRNGFETVYRMIDRATDIIIDSFLNNEKR